MTNREHIDYWRNQKMKTKEILLILKNIKREMNIQPAEKILDKYIQIKAAIEGDAQEKPRRLVGF